MVVNLLELQQNTKIFLKCQTVNVSDEDQDLVFRERDKATIIGKFYAANNSEFIRETKPNPIEEDLYVHPFKGELYENMQDKSEYYQRVQILINKLKTDKSIGLISAITLDDIVVKKFKDAGLNVLFVPIAKMEGEENEKLSASFGNAIIFDQTQVPETFDPLVIIGKTPQSAAWRKEKPEETKPHIATSMYLTVGDQAIGMSYLAHLSSLKERLESLKDVWVYLKKNYKSFVSAGRTNGKDHNTSVSPNEAVVLANIIPALRVEKDAMTEMLNMLGLAFSFPPTWTMFYEKLNIKIHEFVPMLLDSVIYSKDLDIDYIDFVDNRATGTQNKAIELKLNKVESDEQQTERQTLEKELNEIIAKYTQKESYEMEKAINLTLMLSVAIVIGIASLSVSQFNNYFSRVVTPTQDKIQK
jgi:hypothetical protein